MHNGFFGGIITLVLLMFIDVASIVEGVGLFAVIIQAPVIIGVFLYYIHKSPNTDYRPFSKENRLKAFGLLFSIVLSSGGVAVYLLNKSHLIWS